MIGHIILKHYINQMIMNTILMMKLILFLSDNPTSHDLDFPFTCKEVRNGLSKLKINNKEGIDSISNEMLKYGSSVLTLPLVKLFNYILNSTDYPETWNMSLICTIYKKGDKNNCNN